MTDREKVDLIDSFEKIGYLNDSHFEILRKFTFDEDSFVRSRCAALLINFETEESLRLLLHLSNDEDAFVRTEAYDSLGIFYFPEVEAALFKAISFEEDGLAKQYSILSWADVSSKLHDDFKDNISFMLNVINCNQADNYDSNQICLCCYYALQLFGCDVIQNMIDFFNSDEYSIRCSALNLLYDVMNEENEELINSAVVELLKKENTIAVKSEARKFFKKE